MRKFIALIVSMNNIQLFQYVCSDKKTMISEITFIKAVAKYFTMKNKENINPIHIIFQIDLNMLHTSSKWDSRHETKLITATRFRTYRVVQKKTRTSHI